MTTRQRVWTAVVGGFALTLLVIALLLVPLLWSAQGLEPMAPFDVNDGAAAAFRGEFPEIYAPLVELDGYAAIQLHARRGLGGRWGRLTLERAADRTTTRDEACEAVQQALATEAWTPGEIPGFDTLARLLDADATKVSNDDLNFVHLPTAGERQNTMHACRVYVSPDGAEVVAYCEMGW